MEVIRAREMGDEVVGGKEIRRGIKILKESIRMRIRCKVEERQTTVRNLTSSPTQGSQVRGCRRNYRS